MLHCLAELRARVDMSQPFFICFIFLTKLTFSTGQSGVCMKGQWQCDDGICIPETWRCDGEGDCLDGTDELDCDSPPGFDCPPGQFSCQDTVDCVDSSARCDGKIQCPSGFDEENCPPIEACQDSEFLCKNHLCVGKETRCDKRNDCGDNSDEEDCGLCNNNGLRCPDGTCLSAEQRCDGEFHCFDGSDEPITCGRVCSVNNGGCTHTCRDEAWGALCSCPVGFKLAANGAVCEDVDECESPFSPCLHHCTNTPGSYYCQCKDGFKLDGSAACSALGNASRLLVVQRNVIGLLSVKSQQFDAVATAASNPVALAYDIARGWFFWADDQGSIYKSNGRYSRTAYAGEAGIRSLACDWLNGNLFWANQRTETIYMQAVDGKSYKTLLNKNVKPSELVLLPTESTMFWINKGVGDRMTIEKSWMDGSGRSTLTIITAQSAHSLTAEVAAGRLFWISDYKKSIETVKVDGSGRYSFSGLFNKRPALGLAVFESAFYWVDGKGLWQAPVNDPVQRRFVWKQPLPLLAVYHEQQQPAAVSACSTSRCNFCLLTKADPAGFICACPHFKVMLPDGSCHYPRFIYATMATVNFLEFRGRESTETQLFVTDDGILSFDVDWKGDWLYWTNHRGQIKRASLTRVKSEVIQTPSPVCVINVDQRSGNIFWVTCDKTRIGVTNGDGSVQQLYETDKEIRNLFLDWVRGAVFWLEDDKILRMSIFGGSVEAQLQLAAGFSNDVALDIKAGSLLWNSRQGGVTTVSLLQERSHEAGQRWNISGSVVAALEPYLMSASNDLMTLWDRRNGVPIRDVSVKGRLQRVIVALGNVPAVPDTPVCSLPSLLCRHSLLCLPQAKLCDGQKDCPDGDDEETCIVSCPSKEDFKCEDNSNCVLRSLVCDGRSHCRDGSDERNCPTVASPVGQGSVLKCRSGSKPCADGSECVLYTHLCDGEKDCRDGSDELECGSAPVEGERSVEIPPACSGSSVQCPSSAGVCISPSQYCDGVKDCPDGADEKDCIKNCPSKTDLRCKDRRSCVRKSQVCDGRSDCHDGSDEAGCPSVAVNAAAAAQMKCRFGSKMCRDGRECILLSHVCDGERDCKDGSDEEGCDNTKVPVFAENMAKPPKPVQTTTAAPTKPPCTSPSVLCPGSSLCIKPAQMCDGRRDCPDGSDEKCVRRCPSRSDFRCKDRRSCIPKSQVCDGRSDCTDGSDEVGCSSESLPAPATTAVKCRFGSRLCKDGTSCVLLSHICDGERDCDDASDEEGCGEAERTPDGHVKNERLGQSPPIEPTTAAPTKPPCTSPSVLCPGSSLCIKPAQMCDGRRDCPDGSDEKCVRRCSSATDFRCKDRRSCVRKSQVCDGRSDCHDGSDEAGCPSVTVNAAAAAQSKCRFGSKMCRDGRECILLSHVCDGERDCRDGSDEEGCDVSNVAPTLSAETENIDESPTPVQTTTAAPTKPPCTSPSVLCPGSSLCIKPAQMCDGRRDCPDGSDEKCVRRCPSRSDFRCKDRRSCVRKSQVCDGRSDCHDGSDEAGCPSVAVNAAAAAQSKCRFGSRMCRDGRECILLSHVCDGERDCRDGSDEEGCDVSNVAPTLSAETENIDESPTPVQTTTAAPTKPPCTSPSVLCPGSSLCIKPAQMCDGRRDCPDGSDEKCVRRCPSRSDFRCKDRRSCVKKSQVCDGRSDCHDGSDEAGCPSVAVNAVVAAQMKCRFGSRMCRDGRECILLSHVCDGERDCKDGSDEEGCDVSNVAPTLSAETENIDESPTPVQTTTAAPTKPPCTSPSVLCPGSSLCIKPAQMCDGRRDCPDGSDEKCVRRCPSRSDFRCKDRRSCVTKNQVCDGRSDCNDASDEVGCGSIVLPNSAAVLLKCRMGTWPCLDGTECILFSHICDEEQDCSDGSDERGCDYSKLSKNLWSPNKPSCSFPTVLCPNSNVCVAPSMFCDGKRDCPNGSDENCLNECYDQSEFLCRDRQSCVAKPHVCDGRAHCSDGSDEANCPTTPAPQANALQCRVGSRPCDDGGECVLFSHVCDGERDCLDGSDEEGCQETCNKDEFQCAHGKKCIPIGEVCDGKSQCRDLSDELDCWEKTKSCEFRCADAQRCIPSKFLCDGEKDCLDGSDEVGCDSNPDKASESRPALAPPQCVTPSVLCPDSSVCVSQNQLCDGWSDCPDGFDESNCLLHCENPDDFLCSDKRKCVPRAHVCDGRAHCPDGSDEKQCQTSATPTSNIPKTPRPLKCLKGFKPCKDGLECVMYSHVCDGERDCLDGSDEEGCRSRCKAGEFQCAHGSKCIPQELVCDGQNDCQDRSDEMDCFSQSEGCHQRCDNNTRCIPKTFLCDGERDCADGSDEEKCGAAACEFHQFRCASGQCVSEALRCDGYPDCGDRSDELDCRKPPRCPSQLQCPQSHECLEKEWQCDGEEDCKDGSDEKNCIVPTAQCKMYQWQCGEGRWCIPLSWRCDGKVDCHDGKDEDKCTQRKCPSHLYQCGSGECLDPSLVCNGRTNCADSSDEGAGCAKRNCSSPSAPQCDNRCVSTPTGPKCYCAVGFMPHSIASTCEDINECDVTADPVCKHLCLNTPGSYKCQCHPGFYLEPDNKSCKAKDEPVLLASMPTELLLLKVHSGTLELFSSVNQPVYSLDYHWAQQKVYWLSSSYQSFRWADMSGSDKGTLMKGVKSNCIAIDWIGGNVYWLDEAFVQILAAKLGDGQLKSDDYTVILNENLQQPSSLLLLPDRGLMLWSEIGGAPQIERSGMDGSKRKLVVSQELSRPVGLAYDRLDDRLYWADEKMACIASASLDGDNVKLLQLAESPSPFSVAVFNDRVYWSDSTRRTVRSADKRTGKNQKVLLKRPGQPFGLMLMHELAQPNVSNPCESLGCSHICLLAPGDGGKSSESSPAAVCRCPKGLFLSRDKVSCSLPGESSFILLLSHDTVYQIYLRSMSRDGVALDDMPNGKYFSLPGSEDPLTLDLSMPELSLYVADSQRGSVDVLRLSSSKSQPGLALAGQILKLKDDSVSALAVDWVTSNLYWSSDKRADIHVTSRSAGHSTALQQGPLKSTASIALHPASGWLCYIATVMADGNKQSGVYCAWMNGQNKAAVWRRSSVPVSLVFSDTGTAIYWADTASEIIASVGVDGSGYKQFRSGPGLLSFAYAENIFLWTTRDKDSTKLWFTDGIQPKQLWFETKTKLLDIRAYNDDNQSGTNGCAKNNGGCEQLCLPHPEGRTCGCGRGFNKINASSCALLLACPAGEESCSDGSQCLPSAKFCDGSADCPDRSDEQDCPDTDFPSPRSPAGNSRTAQPFQTNQNSVPTDKPACDSVSCSGHGSCVTEGQLAHCQCEIGYKGESCNERDRRIHPLIILGSLCVISGVILAGFILFRRKRRTRPRSRRSDKETLMTNIVLSGEIDDSEEMESSVDVTSPLTPIVSLELH